MVKHKLTSNVRSLAKQQQETFTFTVKTVRALSNGKFIDGGEFRCSSSHDAKTAADRMQGEFDYDCDPCRTYVYKDKDPVPTYAGRQNPISNQWVKERGGYKSGGK